MRLLIIIDEYTRECLAIPAGRSLRSPDVIQTVSDLMTARGVPAHLRPDNGPGFTSGAVREWLGGVGVKTLYIEPGSPWKNWYVESTGGKLRDELLGPEVLYTLLEVRVLAEEYRQTYNRVRPHNFPGHKPPTPEVLMPAGPRPALAGLT